MEKNKVASVRGQDGRRYSIILEREEDGAWTVMARGPDGNQFDPGIGTFKSRDAAVAAIRRAWGESAAWDLRTAGE